MEVRLDSKLLEKVPGFKVGVIEYRGIAVGDSPQMLRGRLQLFQESLYFELDGKAVTDLPGIREWRQVFKACGKDPGRYRHSAEALYRRVQKQNYLHTTNSAIDLNNFLSLQYEIPLGVYDVGAVACDEVVIRIGAAGEEYEGLNGRVNSLEGLVIACDATGGFGSPHVDSVRTSVTAGTTDALHLIFLRPSMEVEDARELVAAVEKMFVQIHGGSSVSWVVAR